MGNMILWLKCKLEQCYRWFWYDLLCRQEPFTYQLSRMMVKHGVFFWIVFMVLAGTCFYHIFLPCKWWDVVLSYCGLFFLAWLIDHLVDQVRLHPGKYNDGE